MKRIQFFFLGLFFGGIHLCENVPLPVSSIFIGKITSFLIPCPQPSFMSIFAQVWPFIIPAIAAIIAIIHIRLKNLSEAEALGIFLMWQIAVGLGPGYLYAGLGHLFAADIVAESIGWPVGSPFQREVGIWDASLGIV